MNLVHSLKIIKDFFIDILFPRICLNCQKEGTYLCEDCQGILEISGFHQPYYSKILKDLYFAAPYQNPLIKNLIQKFKYEPFIKELANPLAYLIITHFQLLEQCPNFSDFILIPIPLDEKKLKWRGFNQAEKITEELAEFFNPVRDSGNKENLQKENISNGVKIPLVNNVLIKRKETLPQVELADEARKENIKGVFLVTKKELIQNKKIILVDDVYTTGATMEECAKVLKEAGAKEIWGIAIARG